MLAKDKLRYFSHDVDMRNDLKIRGLRRKFGNDGYAVWCYLLEVLTDTADLRINFEDMADLLAADFDVEPETLRMVVGYCKQVGLLQSDGKFIFSARHQERITGTITKARELSEARSAAGKRGMQKRWGKNNPDITTDNKPVTTDNVEDKNREEKTRGEKKREDKREYPCDGVVKLWNEICVSLPKVMRLSDARREKVKARLKEWGDGDQDKMLDNARTLFLRIERSDFLTGRSGKWKGASFDWIFDSRNNWIKVMEGNYDNVRGGGSDAPSSTNNLGIGEYIDRNGNRTYGTGKAIIPQDAPPRPSARHSWNASNNQWILQ